jgi:hypothetical protein
MRNIYGIFATIEGTRRFGLTRNKKVAIRLAKRHAGEVRVKPDLPEYVSYDAPTFRVLSDSLADFRSA